MPQFHHNERPVQCYGFRMGLEERANFEPSLEVDLLRDDSVSISAINRDRTELTLHLIYFIRCLL